MDKNLTYYRNKKKLEQTKYELMKLWEWGMQQDTETTILIYKKLKNLFALYEIE